MVFRSAPAPGADGEAFFIAVQHRNIVTDLSSGTPVATIVEPGWG